MLGLPIKVPVTVAPVDVTETTLAVPVGLIKIAPLSKMFMLLVPFEIPLTPPAANNAGSFVLIFTADGTPRGVAWGASVSWPGGTAPTLTSTNGKKDVFGFISLNGGTNWYGFIGGQNI
jgi:hypothetical protein